MGMTEIAFVRTVFLVFAILALLTATLLDGLTMRYLTRPLLRRIEMQSAGKVRYPAPLLFLLEHAWARRLYHGAMGAVALGIWWYLGTAGDRALFWSGQ